MFAGRTCYVCGLLVLLLVASSAFVFPRSPPPPPTLSSGIVCSARKRSNARSTRVGVTSLESPSVAAIDVEIDPSSAEATPCDDLDLGLEQEVTSRPDTTACSDCGEVEADGVVPGARLTRPLYENVANGQKQLFNFALLAVSFGYVIVSVLTIDEGMTRGWSPGEIGLRIPLDTWSSYESWLSEKPIVTKTIINAVIYLLGDWLSQTLFKGENALNFDAARTLKNGFVGACFGPAVHEYYEFSDWILPLDGGITNRVLKILMDQTVYLSVKCSIYIMAVGVLNGDSVGSAKQKVQSRIIPIMFTAWKFWPLVHCVTYGLIPARHRILWVNSVDLVWNAILASKARDDETDDAVESSKELENSKEVLEIEAKNKESVGT